MRIPRLRLWSVLLGGCLMLSACAGTRDATREEPEPPPPPETPLPAPRPEPPPPPPPPREEPPPPPPEPREPVQRTVQGFRIQILTTTDKAAADDGVEAALGWWSSLSAAQRPDALDDEDLDVDVKWKSPYYRVRMGNFTSRAEAEAALNTVRRRFSEAFIVPDAVTIWQ